MSMSDSERRLLLAGTLDTSGVGAGSDEDLRNVALSFRLPVPEEMVTVAVTVSDPEEDEDAPCKTCGAAWNKDHVCPPPAPLVDRPKVPVKRAAKKAASKSQAPEPAES